MNFHPVTPPAMAESLRRAAEAVRPSALRAPAVVAPMYLISGPELVVASSRAGLMGSLPAANARTTQELRSWLEVITAGLREVPDPQWAVSMIVNRDYDRFASELELVAEHRPNLVMTALGSPRRVVDTVRGYGGAVFAEVCSVEQGLKAADAGVDGLVLECEPRGGLSEKITPRTFLDAVRRFFRGRLVVTSGLRTGRAIREVQTLGADLAWVGSRFVGCAEARLDGRRRELLAHCREANVSAAAAMSGVPRSWVAESLDNAERDSAAGRGPGLIGSRSTAAGVADLLVEEYLSAVFALESPPEGEPPNDSSHQGRIVDETSAERR